MKYALVWLWMFGGLFWTGTSGWAAGLSFTPRGLDGAKIEIEIDSFVDTLPERGWADLQVEVRNRLDEEATWDFQFRAHRRNWGNGGTLNQSRRVTVGASSVRTFRFQIPLYPSVESGYIERPRLSVRISGPGAFTDEQFFFRNSGKPSSDPTAYVLFSPGVRSQFDRSSQPWSEMQGILNSDNIPLIFAEVDFDLFPETDQGLLGFDVFLLTRAEWEKYPRKQDLIERWVAQGGDLIFLDEAAPLNQSLGLGSIQHFPDALNLKELAKAIARLDPFAHELFQLALFSETQWDLRELFPDIRKPVGILMLLVIAVAALLGPVNLRLAYRKRNALQVLWLTPVLSLGISAAIGLVILLGDGIGGKGARAQWVLLLPEQRLEVAFQEQVSRTGVLPVDRFDLEEDWWVRPVATHRRDMDRDLRYTLQPGGGYGGDWFQNRTIQAQLLQRVQTSRATVSIRWEEGVPMVLSTVETPFQRFFYRDSSGRVWAASEVRPGEWVRLSATPSEKLEDLQEDLQTRDKGLFPPQRFLRAPEWFYAEGINSQRMVDTLGSIAWEDRPVWFLGPVAGEAQ